MAHDVIPSIETAPRIRERGDVTIPKTVRLGRKLSKLADATPAIVRTIAEQRAMVRLAKFALPILEQRRNALPGKTRTERMRKANITLAMRRLVVPMFGVYMADGNAYFYVSPNVLSDYRREGISCKVLAKARMRRLGRIASIRRATVEQAYVEQLRDSRANDHAMGLAQTVWRLAHAEGDVVAERMAYFWLYHGSTKKCTDRRCKPCEAERQRMKNTTFLDRLDEQHWTIADLVREYLAPNERSNFHGDRRPHRMRRPRPEELSRLFG